MARTARVSAGYQGVDWEQGMRLGQGVYADRVHAIHQSHGSLTASSLASFRSKLHCLSDSMGRAASTTFEFFMRSFDQE